MQAAATNLKGNHEQATAIPHHGRQLRPGQGACPSGAGRRPCGGGTVRNTLDAAAFDALHPEHARPWCWTSPIPTTLAPADSWRVYLCSVGPRVERVVRNQRGSGPRGARPQRVRPCRSTADRPGCRLDVSVPRDLSAVLPRMSRAPWPDLNIRDASRRCPMESRPKSGARQEVQHAWASPFTGTLRRRRAGVWSLDARYACVTLPSARPRDVQQVAGAFGLSQRVCPGHESVDAARGAASSVWVTSNTTAFACSGCSASKAAHTSVCARCRPPHGRLARRWGKLPAQPELTP